MKNSFPSDLNYDYANATSPHLLTPGYFLGQASVLDMFEESTSDNGDGYPTTMTDEGNDLSLNVGFDNPMCNYQLFTLEQVYKFYKKKVVNISYI